MQLQYHLHKNDWDHSHFYADDTHIFRNDMKKSSCVQITE